MLRRLLLKASGGAFGYSTVIGKIAPPEESYRRVVQGLAHIYTDPALQY